MDVEVSAASDRRPPHNKTDQPYVKRGNNGGRSGTGQRFGNPARISFVTIAVEYLPALWEQPTRL
jgi:hypothetical protein